jgi:hypothetical protein
MLLLLACQTTPPPAPEPAAPAPPSLSEIRAGYRDYHLAVSVEPPMQVWMLCRMAIPGVDTPYHSTDIQDARITVYANEAAWPAMQQTGERTFAHGSIIVKEKQSGALGIMQRPEGGGWRYAYVDADGTIEDDQSALTHCSGCHEHGVLPEQARRMLVQLTDPRDAVFLSAHPD